jgi:INO80 complex subunit C
MAQESPTGSGTSTPAPAVNLETLDFGHPTPIHPRPFKSIPTKARTARRNKNLKQILQDEQKALAAQATESEPTNGNQKPLVRGRSGRTLRVEGLQWSDIDAPPSLLPQKKYCDITGLEGKYTDPKTKLRFYNSEVYAVVQTLPTSTDQEVSCFLVRMILILVSGLEKRQCRVEMRYVLSTYLKIDRVHGEGIEFKYIHANRPSLITAFNREFKRLEMMRHCLMRSGVDRE